MQRKAQIKRRGGDKEEQEEASPVEGEEKRAAKEGIAVLAEGKNKGNKESCGACLLF